MVVTSITKQKNNDKRYNIYVDGEYCFSAGCEDVIEFNIREDSMYDEAGLKKLIYSCQYKKAFDDACRMLSVRPKSQMELVKKLKLKYDAGVIDEVIRKLQEYGYIDDTEFSKLWIEERKRLKPAGKKKIAQELRAKGIDKQVVDEAIERFIPDDLDAAVTIAQKKISRAGGFPEGSQELQKLYRYLLYRGFDYDTIRQALEKCKIPQCED